MGEFILAFVIITGIQIELCLSQSTFSFCDGDDLFMISEGDCPGGISFGKRKPTCACSTGVFRFWTDKCEVVDGFAHQHCSILSSPNGGGRDYDDDDEIGGDGDSFTGVKLIRGLRNISEETAVVLWEEEDWQMYLVGMEGLTLAESFYSLNGLPVMMSSKNDYGDERWICVEQSRGGQQVCKYVAHENTEVWVTPEEKENGNGTLTIKIKVMPSCDPQTVEELGDYSVAPLKKHICFDIMDKKTSECELSCEKGRQIRIPGSGSAGQSSTVRQKKAPGGGRKKSKSATGTTGKKEPEGISSEVLGGGTRRILQSPSSNANFDFHRKLNKYVRLRQVGLLPAPDYSAATPSRTFALLEIAKQIVSHSIPNYFVSTGFLDMALELFLYIHKGQDYRYGEELQHRDFNWIEEILLTCRAEVIQHPLNLQGDPRQPGCERAGLIKSICQASEDGSDLCNQTEGGKPHQRGKYHYVIDAIWLIIDMTHVLCHPHFQTSYRMFHVWEQVSEKLFTREIRKLWHEPEVDMRVWDSILSSQAMLNMINLERAVEGAYRLSSLPRLRRLWREMKGDFRRKRRDAEGTVPSVAWNVDVFCAAKDADFDKAC